MKSETVLDFILTWVVCFISGIVGFLVGVSQ